MKIRLKFDKTIMKIGCDGKIESYKNKSNPDEAAFCEIDMDFLYNINKLFPPLFSNQNALSKAQKFNDDLNFQTYEDAAGIPKRLPASGHDIYNYVARYGAANYQIQAIMKLDGQIHPDKLIKAVRLSLDAEPVFGCRFVENQPPYWQRLDDIDNTTFCSFEKTDNVEEAVQRFLESPFSMDNDPMIKLKLIRSGGYDTLCFKINHTCCDGTGAKEYFQLLSDIYNRLDNGEDNFEPKPRIRNRSDQDRLFNALGIKDPESAWKPEVDIPDQLWTFPWRQGKPDIARVVRLKYPKGSIEAMSRYGKERGAGINDLILTALYRTMFEISHTQNGVPMHISMTVDLRRYLPDQKATAIRNFSGGVDSKIARMPNETFEGTLSRVVTMMNEIKKGNPGLQSAVGLERVEKADFYGTLSYYRDAQTSLTYTDEFAPVLSNLGIINNSILKFGGNKVTEAYFVPPALSAPGILICISTYNGILTFAVSYYDTQAKRENMERFLNLIKQELLEGIGKP